MARYRTFDEEMQHLRNLLDTVSSDEENLEEDNDFPENEEPDDEEYFSNKEETFLGVTYPARVNPFVFLAR
ncbi:hypothetical protein AVEN_191694-1, partial [Araneus ventricosus]